MDLFQQCVTPWALVMHFFSGSVAACEEIYQAGLPVANLSFSEYFPYFLKTFVLELPFYYFLLAKSQSFARIVMITFLLNVATHPIIFLGLPALLVKFDFNYLQYLLVAETFAPLTEALLLRFAFAIEGRKAFWGALIANLFSWGVGVWWS